MSGSADDVNKTYIVRLIFQMFFWLKFCSTWRYTWISSNSSSKKAACICTGTGLVTSGTVSPAILTPVIGTKRQVWWSGNQCKNSFGIVSSCNFHQIMVYKCSNFACLLIHSDLLWLVCWSVQIRNDWVCVLVQILIFCDWSVNSATSI